MVEPNLLLVFIAPRFAIVAAFRHFVRRRSTRFPELSDVQVIVYNTEYPGQGPQVVEDQITYTLSTAMLTVPKSKVVRGFSVFPA